MKSRNLKDAGLFVSLSLAVLFMASSAFATGATWAQQHAAPAAPPISQDSCDAYKAMKISEIQDGQADRDYVDQQAAYYKSAAHQTYTQLQARVTMLQAKYKKEISAINDGIMSGDEVSTIQDKMNADLKADLSTNFAIPYTFCPANSIEKLVGDDDEKQQTCVPQKGKWKSLKFQSQDRDPQNISVTQVSFQFDSKPNGSRGASKGQLPKLSVTMQGSETNGAQLNPYFSTLSEDDIFKGIWPTALSQTPGPSQRPEAILADELHQQGCDRYEPGYKSSTVKVTQPKVVDERTGKVINGSSGKTESAPAGQ